jgi:hypothetical protein
MDEYKIEAINIWAVLTSMIRRLTRLITIYGIIQTVAQVVDLASLAAVAVPVQADTGELHYP